MPINSHNTLTELVTRYHQNPEQFAFFVGAGLSQPLFPSWSKLLTDFVAIAKECGLSYDSAELIDYINKGEKYLEIAEACVATMGTPRYRDLLENVFDKEFLIDEIPESYKALMDLMPKTIITTNYDRIPDIAGKGLYRISTNKNAPEAGRNLSNGKKIVFKMHGDINDQSSIVLTSSEYQNIINCNQSTKNLLISILSTRTLIFVGFSLSDPHIDMILNNLKTINNIPISHYVLLNESSMFKISSFENKYGVKIISYLPTDSSHPEVVEFLRSLNSEISTTIEKKIIPQTPKFCTQQEIINHLEVAISLTIVDASFSVFFEESNLYISFSPSGETTSEIQKEVLSLIRLINFETEIINEIIIAVFTETIPNENVDESQAAIFNARIKFNDAINYAKRNVSTSTLWKQITFISPTSISDPFQVEKIISIPMSTGILGE